MISSIFYKTLLTIIGLKFKAGIAQRPSFLRSGEGKFSVIPAFLFPSERRDVKCAPGDFVTDKWSVRLNPAEYLGSSEYGVLEIINPFISLIFYKGGRGVYLKP